MQPIQTIAPAQQIAAFALSAVLTVLVLFSLGAHADTQHADALASAQGSSQQPPPNWQTRLHLGMGCHQGAQTMCVSEKASGLESCSMKSVPG